MTKDDIIKLSLEADAAHDLVTVTPFLERFANLVAAHKTEVALAEAYSCGYDAGIKDERRAWEGSQS